MTTPSHDPGATKKFDPDYTSAYYDDYGDRESARWEAGPRSLIQHAIYRHHLQHGSAAGTAFSMRGVAPGPLQSSCLNWTLG